MTRSRKNVQLSLTSKLLDLDWLLVILVTLIASIGFAMLYSAGGGEWDRWAKPQMIRFGLGFAAMIVAALMPINFWFRMAWPIYFAGLALLVAVELVGTVGMGAQRWIDLGFMRLQPSELMKIAIVIVMARFYHMTAHEDTSKPLTLILAAMIMIAPVALVLKQPDLGTALMLVMVWAAILFGAGVKMWIFIGSGISALASIPIAWQFLKEYQKRRVTTFMNPEDDPLGAGYHIMQSKIALGSGGLNGKGYLSGSQSHLNFLPEKQTDFIFTMFAEEFGFKGGVVLLLIFALVLLYGLIISWRARNNFGRLLALGLTVNFFLYIFINIGMVMGLLPVVGVPLPLISYGGTVMLTIMVGFGLLLSVSIHKDYRISKRGQIVE